MKKIYLNMPDLFSCGYLRAVLPHRFCSPILEKENIQIELESGMNIEEDYRAYIFHRLVNPQVLPYLWKIKQRGMTLVEELDDNFFEIPQDNPAKNMVLPQHLEALRLTFEWADYIITSTEPLKDQLGFAPKTEVLPNLIDLSDWKAVREPIISYDHKKWTNFNPCKIMWMGSNTHLNDLNLTIESLIKIKEKYKENVQLIFFGQMPNELKNIATYIEGQSLEVYSGICQLVKPDICLTPLIDHKFNQAKSCLKWLESTLAGGAVIASPVAPYISTIRHDETGLIVQDNNWGEPIEELITNHKLRNRLWINAYDDVRINHSWQNSKEKENWLNFFRKVAG